MKSVKITSNGVVIIPRYGRNFRDDPRNGPRGLLQVDLIDTSSNATIRLKKEDIEDVVVALCPLTIFTLIKDFSQTTTTYTISNGTDCTTGSNDTAFTVAERELSEK